MADEKNTIHEFFTLEKTLIFKNYPYLVCGQVGIQHYNFGIECSDNFEEFEDTVYKLMKEKYKIDGFK